MSEEPRYTIAQLVQHVTDTYNELDAYLRSLTEAQRTQLTDAAGWSVKDHIANLAIWERGADALLQGRDRGEAMGLPPEVWARGDHDEMNEVIRRRHAALSLNETHDLFRAIHEQMLARLRTLSDDDLYRPYRHYQPDSDREEPVINWIYGNTAGHYAEHRPWIEAIVASGQ